MPYQLTVQRNQNFYNVKDYGAQGDGVTDDTVAVAAAISAATGTGGTVHFPPGTYVCGNQTLTSNVYLQGSGSAITIIKLKNAANTDLFSAQTGSINLSAAAGSGSLGSLLNFGLSNLTLDGNKANQSSGTSYPLRFYGYNFTLKDMVIQSGYTGGMLCDWNGGSLIAGVSDQEQSRLMNVKIHDCNGIGLQMGGPHDSMLVNVLSYNNGSHGFHTAPNATGILFMQCHSYHLSTGVNAVGFLVEGGGNHFVNCMFEGSDIVQTAILANDCSVFSGETFNLVASNSSIGIQIGQTSGQTPFPGQINQSAGVTTAVQVSGANINTKVVQCQGGAFWFANEINNKIIAHCYQTAGGALHSNASPNNSDMVDIWVGGQTSDNTPSTTPFMRLASTGATAFTVRGPSSNRIFNLNGSGSVGSVEIANGTTLIGYSDVNTTQKYKIDAATGNASFGGYIAAGVSTSAAVIANNATITTTNLGTARIAPTANVTGIILQAGTLAGQRVVVRNESAFTVTFDVAGTSHVADGATSAIPANCSREFEWNSVGSVWSRMA